MDKGKIAGGIFSLTLVGLAIGYVVATGYLSIRYGLSTGAFDITLLAREYRALGATAPKDFLWVNLILSGFGVAALLLSVTLREVDLPAHAAGRGRMAFSPNRAAVSRQARPPKSSAVLVQRLSPWVIVAPTRQGVGFVIPNLLARAQPWTDAKGENFREIALPHQHGRQLSFAPTDWDRPRRIANPLPASRP
jgi:type IV secretion system protein VirD4